MSRKVLLHIEGVLHKDDHLHSSEIHIEGTMATLMAIIIDAMDKEPMIKQLLKESLVFHELHGEEVKNIEDKKTKNRRVD